MKKQIKKLSLNKRTISNLGSPEMKQLVGGASQGCSGNTIANCSCFHTHCPTCNDYYTCKCTQGKTCNKNC